MGIEAVCQAACDEKECPTCGGSVRERVYSEMYAGSFILDGQRMEIRREPRQGFSDPIWLEELTQFFEGKLYRVWPSSVYLTNGSVGSLHRAVWKSAFGDIPKGCHIHHRDSNPRNNRIDNLECV